MGKRTPPNRVITPDDLAAAERLRALWEERVVARKITQEAASETLGMSQGAISQFLCGKVALGLHATLKFAGYLNAHPSDIRPDFGPLLDQAVGQVSLQTVTQALPPDARRSTLRYVRYELERNRTLVAQENLASYEAALKAVDDQLTALEPTPTP